MRRIGELVGRVCIHGIRLDITPEGKEEMRGYIRTHGEDAATRAYRLVLRVDGRVVVDASAFGIAMSSVRHTDPWTPLEPPLVACADIEVERSLCLGVSALCCTPDEHTCHDAFRIVEPYEA